MKDDITHVIWVPMTIDRPKMPTDEIWVKNRIKLFEEFTLPSILNQDFDDDVQVLLICGQRHKALTASHPWHPKVHAVHDEGREFISGISTPFLAQSRIDSDDLYHRKALSCVHRFVLQNRLPSRLTGLVFRENLYWSRLQNFIGSHVRMCSPPPFTTRIFPHSLYSDWDTYRSLTYVVHGNATYKLFMPINMDRNMVCVVKHGLNFSHVKRKEDPAYVNDEQMARYLKTGVIRTNKLEEVKRILADFGVPPEKVDTPPPTIFRGGMFTGL